MKMTATVIPLPKPIQLQFVPERLLYEKNGFQIAQGKIKEDMHIGIRYNKSLYTVMPKDLTSFMISMLWECDLTGINFPEVAQMINDIPISKYIPKLHKRT